MTRKYIAKPLINNNKGIQEFDTIKKAVTYLNSFLLDDMPTLHADDYFLIGKLYADDGSTDWLTPVQKVGRPTKGK